MSIQLVKKAFLFLSHTIVFTINTTRFLCTMTKTFSDKRNAKNFFGKRFRRRGCHIKNAEKQGKKEKKTHAFLMWQNQRLPKLEQKSLIARTSPYECTAERVSEDRTKNIIKKGENEGFIFVFYLKIDEKLCQINIRDTVLFERCPFFVRFCLNATASCFL